MPVDTSEPSAVLPVVGDPSPADLPTSFAASGKQCFPTELQQWSGQVKHVPVVLHPSARTGRRKKEPLSVCAARFLHIHIGLCFGYSSFAIIDCA